MDTGMGADMDGDLVWTPARVNHQLSAKGIFLLMEPPWATALTLEEGA